MYTTCCKILDLNPGASQSEIKQAYRKKAKMYHPDHNPSPSANQEFIRVKQAFDYLIEYDPHRYSCSSNGYRYHSSRWKYRYRARSYDQERYRRFQEYMRQFRHKTRKDIDFKTTLFGKIVFYFFHALFLFTGIYILVCLVISVVSNGIDLDQNAAATISAVIGASLFGLIMVVMITLSGLSVNLFKRAL
jgi:hypothetical protein